MGNIIFQDGGHGPAILDQIFVKPYDRKKLIWYGYIYLDLLLKHFAHKQTHRQPE